MSFIGWQPTINGRNVKHRRVLFTGWSGEIVWMARKWRSGLFAAHGIDAQLTDLIKAKQDQRTP